MTTGDVTIQLTKNDLRKILDLTDKVGITDDKSFKLIANASSGIGTIVDVAFNSSLNGVPVEVSINVCGVEDW